MGRKGGGLAAIMAGQPMVTVQKKTPMQKMKKAFRACGLHFGLIAACMIYICVGAQLFIWIEKPNEERVRQKTDTKIAEEKEKFLNGVEFLMDKYSDDIRTFNDSLNILFDEYTEQMFELFKDPLSANVFESSAYFDGEYQQLWTTSSAVLFTSTTVVPVGFGLVTPLTTTGRIFVICYAIVGIPLALVTMSDLGKFFCDASFRLFNEQTTLFMCALIILLFAYPVVGGVVMSNVSTLSLFDSIYYCSIAILTVGFGDIGPPIPVPYLILFIVVGVTLVTISVDVVAANVIHHVHYLGRQMENAKELAGKMMAMAQKISINKGLGLGMAQLGAFARFGVMMRVDGVGRHSVSTLARPSTAFDPDLNVDFVDTHGDYKPFDSFSSDEFCFIDG